VTGGGTPAVKTFEDWLVATGQDAETRRAFWDPFFIPALNAPFDRIDNADAMFVLKTAFIEDASAARFGFSTVPLAHLAAAAAQRLDAVHLSTAVVGIDPGLERGVTLQLLGDRCAAFDAVVVAVPPRVLAKLLGDAGAYGIEGLDAFDPFPIVDVHLWHDGPSMGFDFAAALESPLQWIFEKQTGYLCCSFSAADEYVRFTNDELQALAWREVQTYVGALRGSSLLRGAVTRNPEATYLPRLGVQRPGQTTLRPAVAIAGAWTQTGWPDTMESAVRSGIAAAEALGAAPRGYGEHAAGAVAVGATP
jgi:predicted NAD/FAD-binding protein